MATIRFGSPLCANPDCPKAGDCGGQCARDFKRNPRVASCATLGKVARALERILANKYEQDCEQNTALARAVVLLIGRHWDIIETGIAEGSYIGAVVETVLSLSGTPLKCLHPEIKPPMLCSDPRCIPCSLHRPETL